MKKILCCLFVIFSIMTVFACPKYRVVDLGTLDKDVSVATSINDKGEVCGIFKPKDQSQTQLFLWSECTGIICPGVMTNLHLDNCVGARISRLMINKTGQVVGSYLINTQNNNMLCMWDPQVGLKNLHNQLDRSGVIHDFNDAGEVVYTKSGSVYVYNTNNSQLQNLSTLFDSRFDIRINNKSELFGTAMSSTGYLVARLYTLCEKRTYDINNKIKSNFYGKSINDWGQCAIHWQAPNGHGACTWSLIAGIQPITWPFAGAFPPKKINNKGQMISHHPTLIYDGCNWISLDEVLNLANDPSTLFESIEVIHDINNKGQMVGTGIIRGKSHAVLISPVHCDCRK